MMAATASTSPHRGLRRVLVVDDHAAVCDLFEAVLTPTRGLSCVGVAATAEQALRLLPQRHPDVVLMDVALGPDDGLALTRVMIAQSPGLAVVLLTGLQVEDIVTEAAACGASCVLPKTTALSDILDALRHARADMFSLPPGQLLAITRDPNADSLSLTAREQEVLEHLENGRDVRAISRLLGISIHTARGYVKTILAKLGAHSQLEAVHAARERGLIPPPRLPGRTLDP